MTTPIRRQYLSIKAEHNDALLLFRMGDFYETFDNDAEIISKDLDIALTSREMGKDNRVPLAGIPYHALDSYLAKLINKGHKIAICEQITDIENSSVKGLMDREVVRVITPGTIIEPSILNDKKNNYIVSLVLKNNIATIAFIDTSSSNIIEIIDTPSINLPLELDRINPAEIISSEDQPAQINEFIITNSNESFSNVANSRKKLLSHFNIHSLNSFDIANNDSQIIACAALITYLSKLHKQSAAIISNIRTTNLSNYMQLDKQTRRNLEIYNGGIDGIEQHSLLAILDKTQTSMGARLMRNWIGQPLITIDGIQSRQGYVEMMFNNPFARNTVRSHLKKISDLERLAIRVKNETASPRDLLALKQSLQEIPNIKFIYRNDKGFENINPELIEKMDDCAKEFELLEKSINEDSGPLGEGNVFKSKYNSELDDIRSIAQNARKFISKLEQSEQVKTGIKNLKIGYNRVFGYYIEISNSNIHNIPDEYERKQTLTNGERFTTAKLKEYEKIILQARENLLLLENSLYKKLLNQISLSYEIILNNAQLIAELDVYCSLAHIAQENTYIKPDINDTQNINIINGRHPIIENSLSKSTFIPNDTILDNQSGKMMLLTGPNMAGKSTYLRQTGLIVLMAQIGSFVPAEKASIGIVDRIFTRIGLQDDLFLGQSTFMIEMSETALILRNATNRSLLILDEIGRGTDTKDGLAIAHSIIQHIHNNSELGSRTLFATHYHELVYLPDQLPQLTNYNVEIIEDGENLVFLHKVNKGKSKQSYGIQVAKLAGIPQKVIDSANLYLDSLPNKANGGYSPDTPKTTNTQMQLFQTESIIEKTIKNVEIEKMTPLEALNLIENLKKKLIDEN
ncbi:MAG: DNA mismatch repair protein MutS [Chloroflexi bacterium]|nr:DNA mismatch repair protein MutS [Chloroflexota bacterium]|tara:strand:- start:12330 stop:14903 length:2574 start_codon:yes stop_codon:yes gene_type:complete